MNDLTIFVPFQKKNDDQCIVEGVASSEALDSQGEVVKYDAIKEALPHYLGDYDAKTGKYRFGSIREMHQWSAVGKTLKTFLDDTKKQLVVTAKVVDKNAWEKVKEGVYNGFSIGGKVIKRTNNMIEALTLSEISLVDRPANPAAIFSMVKVNKAGVMEPVNEAPAEQAEDESVFIARYILDLAADIRMLLQKFQREGKSLVELNRALSSLKELAVKVLTEEDKKKFDKILYSMNFQELEKIIPTGWAYSQPKAEVKEMDIKKYVDHSWMPGYFEDVRKVLK